MIHPFAVDLRSGQVFSNVIIHSCVTPTMTWCGKDRARLNYVTGEDSTSIGPRTTCHKCRLESMWARMRDWSHIADKVIDAHAGAFE
jgi:hypothetical protein